MLQVLMMGANVAIVRPALMMLLMARLAAAQAELDFGGPLGTVDEPHTVTYSRVVLLRNGDRLFVGSHPAPSRIDPFIRRSQMALVTDNCVAYGDCEWFPTDRIALGGSGNDVPRDAAVDPLGNVWIVGTTDSDDFQLVNPIFAQKAPYRTAGFVVELDATGRQVLLASYLAGRAPLFLVPFWSAPPDPCSTVATAIAIDGAGNVYVGGSSDEPDFLRSPAPVSVAANCRNAFGETFTSAYVVKISPGGKLIYGSLLGSGSSSCIGGGSFCIGRNSAGAGVDSLAVDPAGAVTVSGTQSCRKQRCGYVSRLAPDSTVVWSTGHGADYGAVVRLYMAQDSGGGLYLFGKYAPLTYEPIPNFPPKLGTPGLFAEKLTSDSSGLLYSTDLGAAPDADAAGILLDASGNAYLAGASSSPKFPFLAAVPNLGPAFVLRLDSAGVKPAYLVRLPAGAVTAPPLFGAGGTLLVPGAQGALLSLPLDYRFDTPALAGFANSASFSLSTGLYPGTLVTFLGWNLPAAPQTAQVLIDDIPAPVLYASPYQINVQVPFGTVLYKPRLPVTIQGPSGSLSAKLPLIQSLGIFTIDGTHATALNPDGAVNSPSNPAPRGSVVTLFGTGAFWSDRNLQDGAMANAASPLNQTWNSFEVIDTSGVPANILYAGAAPGLLSGVFRLDVQLPAGISQPLTLRSVTSFGVSLSSNPVQIYVK